MFVLFNLETYPSNAQASRMLKKSATGTMAREAREEMRKQRDVDRRDSTIVSLVQPFSLGYPMWYAPVSKMYRPMNFRRAHRVFLQADRSAFIQGVL